MEAPSVSDIVRVWELGQDKPTWYRALLLLAPACPDADFAALAALSLGQRNARLFSLREVLFGADLEAFVTCPRCAAPLEFGLTVDAIRQPAPPPASAAFEMRHDDVTLRYRLLDSRDLAAAEEEGDAHRRLAARCILEAARDGAPLAPDEVPPDVHEALADALVEQDPNADLLLGMDCPACGHTWSARFDVAAYLWAEVAAEAQRVLTEVDLLARTYGWPEADILAMSAARRTYYLERNA